MRRDLDTPAGGLSLPVTLALVVLGGLAAFSIAAVGSPGQAFACQHVHAATRSLSKSDARDAMRCMINGARKHHELRLYRPNGGLAEAAQKHTRRMRKENCFSHWCPGEPDPTGRARESGYIHGSTFYVAENIAVSEIRRSNPRSIFRGWMNSPGHRANILSSQSKHIGVGVSATHGKAWWTTDFGSH